MSIHAADELTEAISELRGLFPDWRMGQLVANLMLAAGIEDSAIWNIEDGPLLAAARRLIERNRGRREGRVEPAATAERIVVPSSGPPASPPPRPVG